MVLRNAALCQIDQNSPVRRLTAKETNFLAQVAGYWSRTIRVLAPLHHEVQGNLRIGVFQ